MGEPTVEYAETAVLYSLPRAVYLTLEKVLVQDEAHRAAELPAVLSTIEAYPLERLATVLPTLLLIAQDAPFEDLRGAFNKLLQRLDKQALRLAQGEIQWSQSNRISSFVKNVSWDKKDCDIAELLQEEFLWTGRVSNLSKILAYHPTYLTSFMETSKRLMSSEGPLSVPWRHYIAIMAASRHQCRYLVATHIALYLRHGGDPSWLQGTEYIPLKLRGLLDLNALLAHQPWMISAQTIATLAAGNPSSPGTGWNIAEIVHATVLMAHFHALASVIFSNGVLPEVDIARAFALQGRTSANVSHGSDSRDKEEDYEEERSSINSGIAVAAAAATAGSKSVINCKLENDEKMKHRSVEAIVSSGKPDIDKTAKEKNAVHRDASIVDQRKKTENLSEPITRSSSDEMLALSSLSSLVEAQAVGGSNLGKDGNSDLSKISRDETRLRAHLVAAGSDGDLEALLGDEAEGGAVKPDLPADFERAADLGDANVRVQHAMPSDLCVYTGNDSIAYVDFHSPSEQRVQIMRLQDFCWEDHCFPLLSRFYSACAEPLDRQYREIYDLTYYMLGNEADIDTLPFRRAVWYYTQSLLGVRNDDYDYREVNVLINIPTKVFIKKVCCYPEAITADDFSLFSTSLLPSEKCHISLLAANARNQSSLIYALRAIEQQMMQ
eukprot:g3218.t1